MGFEECLKNGEVGEHIAWNLLSKNKNIATVIDMRDSTWGREQDVDFMVIATNKDTRFVEVKTDFKAHETGNIAYELKTSGNAGCFYKTAANWVLYYVPYAKVVYWIDVRRMREHIQARSYSVVRMGDYAEGYLIPIDDLVSDKVIYHISRDVK